MGQAGEGEQSANRNMRCAHCGRTNRVPTTAHAARCGRCRENLDLQPAGDRQPPPGVSATLYEILGVSANVSLDEIRHAYMEGAKRWHPDHHRNDTEAQREFAAERFRDVHHAYEVLSDPKRRADYDDALRLGEHLDPDAPDEREPGTWLARAVLAAVASRLGDADLPNDTLVWFAGAVFGEISTRLTGPALAVSASQARTAAYRAASITEATWQSGPVAAGDVDFTNLAFATIWATCYELWATLMEGERTGLSAPRDTPRVVAAEPVFTGTSGAGVSSAGPPASGLIPPGGCQVCGRGPAVRVSLNEVRGNVIFARSRQVKGMLCRDCGLATGREMQSTTLNLGWWGLVSAILTPFAVIGNGSELSKLAKLTPPADAPQAGLAALDPGKPVLQRPSGGLLAALAVLFVLGVIWAGQAGTHSAPATPPSTTSFWTTSLSTTTTADFSPPTPAWAVGDCIYVALNEATPIDCSEYHQGVVLARAFASSQCPVGTTNYVQTAGWTWCIDES
jgi:DnaJ domain